MLPWLQQMDRDGRRRGVPSSAARIELLDGCDLFEQVADGDLTQLAGAGRAGRRTAGQVVVAEGEPADAFYVVASGRMAVTSASGVDVPDLDVGDYFGEIGLLERIPRTATVTAAAGAQPAAHRRRCLPRRADRRQAVGRRSSTAPRCGCGVPTPPSP